MTTTDAAGALLARRRRLLGPSLSVSYRTPLHIVRGEGAYLFDADGRGYLMTLISNGVGGLDLAEQLKALGCTDALGGDDDSSTQATWRGASVQSHSPRTVPDALGVYVRSQ